LRGGIDLVSAQLDFEGAPLAVGQLHNGIDFPLLFPGYISNILKI